jgi:hypothetical protein
VHRHERYFTLTSSVLPTHTSFTDKPQKCKCCIWQQHCVRGGSNMTGTNCDLFTHNKSRSYLNHLVLGRSLGAFAKLRRATINFVMSVCPHRRARLPINGILWDLIFDTVSNICRENSSFIKIRQKITGILHVEVFHIYDNISLNSAYNEKCFKLRL